MATARSMTSAPWQSNKSVNECNKCMLEKELYTDVTFLVGNEETEVKEIKAHRYILISRSPVFEAMLCGDLRENGPIRIPDTDWKTFMSFLRFLYYEDFPEDPAILLPLLYLAAKYIIPTLEQKCEEELNENITTENVCIILEQSLFYDKTVLSNNCMKFIRINIKDVVKQKSFLDTNQNTLKYILGDDKLNIGEQEVFEACVSWGKHQCGVAREPQTGENIRNALGDALYCIRFPIMQAKYVADKVAPLKILSELEMLNLFILIIGSKKENETPFNVQKRVNYGKIYCCDRLQQTCTCWFHNGNPDAIAFQADKDIYCQGIKVYVGNDGNAKYSFKLEIYQRDVCLGSIACEASGGSQPKDIKLADPVPLSKGTLYDIVLTTTGPSVVQGTGGKNAVISHGVKFTFSDSSRDKNTTRVTSGQIPGLLFSTYN